MSNHSFLALFDCDMRASTQRRKFATGASKSKGECFANTGAEQVENCPKLGNDEAVEEKVDGPELGEEGSEKQRALANRADVELGVAGVLSSVEICAFAVMMEEEEEERTENDEDLVNAGQTLFPELVLRIRQPNVLAISARKAFLYAVLMLLLLLLLFALLLPLPLLRLVFVLLRGILAVELALLLLGSCAKHKGIVVVLFPKSEIDAKQKLRTTEEGDNSAKSEEDSVQQSDCVTFIWPLRCWA